MSVAAVILAAGGSRRLGRPKQLVVREGETLLHRTARLALEAGCAPVVLVLGAHEAECRKTVADLEVQVASNSTWEEGMGSSVRVGAAALPAEAEAALLLVCDQLALDAHLLEAFLAEHRRDPNRTLAAAYGGVLGVPALFPKARFPELLALAGDQGARALLRRGDVLGLPFEGGAWDLDRPGDLEPLG